MEIQSQRQIQLWLQTMARANAENNRMGKMTAKDYEEWFEHAAALLRNWIVAPSQPVQPKVSWLRSLWPKAITQAIK